MSGPRLLSESIPRIAGQVFSRKYIMLGRLVTRWADIVGQDLADKAQPVKIRTIRSKNGNTVSSLDIAATPASATILHYRKDLILERINQIFGEQLVSAIRFVPIAANAKPPALPSRLRPLTGADRDYLADTLKGIEDSDIRDRLQSLGQAILQEAPSGI
ncbi:MAG TPA: DciA family protein [Patescibacteria group bacterium]|jgi:hypothetical protein|nr:DciA family protein [Patescibacteria group bacterium]